MKKNITMNFIKDKLNIVLMFSINTFVLVLFFNVAPGVKREVIYPIVISTFFLTVMLLIEGYKYHNFNFNLIKANTDLNYDLYPKTAEQKQFCSFLRCAHNKHIVEFDELLSKQEKNKLFLSQWIHNLKTPISVIDLILEKLKSEDGDLKEDLEEVSFQNRKLFEGIENILNINRLEKFEKDYIPKNIDLVSSLKRVINQRKEQFILCKVFPDFENELTSANILTDLKWNEVLLDQIVSNAIKYSCGKDIVKKIYFQIKLESNATILTIRDEGIGIPCSDQKRIFEPFFTGENGRKVKGATGIGLYVCSEIAEKLGHKVIITSEVGKGTEVTIRYLTKL